MKASWRKPARMKPEIPRRKSGLCWLQNDAFPAALDYSAMDLAAQDMANEWKMKTPGKTW